MRAIIRTYLTKLPLHPPASSEAIQAIETAIGSPLPPLYQEFHRITNGLEGGHGSKYLRLLPVEELLALNEKYALQAEVPGLFLFADDSRGHVYGFKMDLTPPLVTRVNLTADRSDEYRVTVFGKGYEYTFDDYLEHHLLGMINSLEYKRITEYRKSHPSNHPAPPVPQELALTPPLAQESLQQIEARLGVTLPADYLQFLLQTNGSSGGTDNTYFHLWPAQDLRLLEGDPTRLLIASDAVHLYGLEITKHPATITQIADEIHCPTDWTFGDFLSFIQRQLYIERTLTQITTHSPELTPQQRKEATNLLQQNDWFRAFVFLKNRTDDAWLPAVQQYLEHLYQWHTCLACGFDKLDDEQYDAEMIPNENQICPCCTWQAGFEDDDQGYTFETYREKWISDGTPWFYGEKPKD